MICLTVLTNCPCNLQQIRPYLSFVTAEWIYLLAINNESHATPRQPSISPVIVYWNHNPPGFCRVDVFPLNRPRRVSVWHFDATAFIVHDDGSNIFEELIELSSLSSNLLENYFKVVHSWFCNQFDFFLRKDPRRKGNGGCNGGVKWVEG